MAKADSLNTTTPPPAAPASYLTAAVINHVTDNLAASVEELRRLGDAAPVPMPPMMGEVARLLDALGDIDLALMDLEGLSSILMVMHGDGGEIPSEAMGGLHRLASVTHERLVEAHAKAGNAANALRSSCGLGVAS